jgi:hypothetical protein
LRIAALSFSAVRRRPPVGSLVVLAFLACLALSCARDRRTGEAHRDVVVPAAAPVPDVVPPPPAVAVDAPPPHAERPDAAVVPAYLVAGWIAADAPRLYVPDDLHLLVDGGDGVFFRYGFAWAARRTYRTEKPSNRRVRVEVYAFDSPAGALGRYDHESLESGTRWSTEPPPPELAGKVYAARLDADQLRLARGRFLVLLRYEDDAETDPAKLIADARTPLLAFAAVLGQEFGNRGDEVADQHR